MPFGFENMKLNVEGFKDLVRNWWEGYNVNGSYSHILASKLKALKQDPQVQNREVVGNLSTNKVATLNKIGFGDAKTKETALSMEESEVKRG